MNTLLNLFETNRECPINTEIHEKHLAKFVGQSPGVIEIGVGRGGALETSKGYFGEGTRMIGFETAAGTTAVEEPLIEIVNCDQACLADLPRLVGVSGPPHVIIDDGGHFAHQFQISCEVLIPNLRDGRVYLVEDVHTCYWKEFEGGFLKHGTFIERTKELTDDLHGWHQRADGRGMTMYSQTLKCLSRYDSNVVVDKSTRRGPVQRLRVSIDKLIDGWFMPKLWKT